MDIYSTTASTVTINPTTHTNSSNSSSSFESCLLLYLFPLFLYHSTYSHQQSLQIINMPPAGRVILQLCMHISHTRFHQQILLTLNWLMLMQYGTACPSVAATDVNLNSAACESHTNPKLYTLHPLIQSIHLRNTYVYVSSSNCTHHTFTHNHTISQSVGGRGIIIPVNFLFVSLHHTTHTTHTNPLATPSHLRLRPNHFFHNSTPTSLSPGHSNPWFIFNHCQSSAHHFQTNIALTRLQRHVSPSECASLMWSALPQTHWSITTTHHCLIRTTMHKGNIPLLSDPIQRKAISYNYIPDTVTVLPQSITNSKMS